MHEIENDLLLSGRICPDRQRCFGEIERDIDTVLAGIGAKQRFDIAYRVVDVDSLCSRLLLVCEITYAPDDQKMNRGIPYGS